MLPASGKSFLDRSALLRALFGTPGECSVINLDFLLHNVVRNVTPLDWPTFWANNRLQPINIIASGLSSMRSLTLTSQGGHFESLDSLLQCLRASMCVPGVAGPTVRLIPSSEPMADAMLFEPIPYRSAVEDGCTHVVCLRSRPDGSEVRVNSEGLGGGG